MLNTLIATFNEFVLNITSSPISDNATIGDFIAVNAETPKTRIQKFLYVKNLLVDDSYLLKSLYIYFIFICLCLFTLLALIVVKPSLLSYLEPKGQELTDKIDKHFKAKLELNSILDQLKTQKQDLIDMSTES